MRWILVALLALWSSAAMAATPIKVMILDGASAAAYHDWKLGSQIFKRQLEETGLFEVTVVTVPPSDGDFSNVHPDFAKYQAVVLNYDSQDWPVPLKAAFEAYMKNGGGLVVVHGADNAFPDWPAFNEMIGVGGWRKRDAPAGPKWYYQNGKLTSDSAPGPAGMHGKRRPFRLTARAPQHPILRGLPPSWMHAARCRKIHLLRTGCEGSRHPAPFCQRHDQEPEGRSNLKHNQSSRQPGGEPAHPY